MENPSRAIRILVVDDYEPFRRFLRFKLHSRPELQIVGEALDGLQAVQKAEELQPDLILLDIGLPRLNGIEAANRISRLLPMAKILFVSQENDTDVIAAALSLGGRGYLRKQSANSELLSAVEAVLQEDNLFVSTERLRSSPVTQPAKPHLLLQSNDDRFTGKLVCTRARVFISACSPLLQFRAEPFPDPPEAHGFL
jgi:DNA-binding NarL/FixJ family response regulator